jgi:hypothetical protein
MVVVRWQIALYGYVSSHLALSRKYGTVWYHPASSKFWYLTALSFVNFQEKLTGTSFALCACEASFVRLAVCLALSALFASTNMTSEGGIIANRIARYARCRSVGSMF